MEPLWHVTPPQEQRTFVWDVSGTDWARYPAGKCLTSPSFSCAGVDGLDVQFYPQGYTAAGAKSGQFSVYARRLEDDGRPLFVKARICVDGVPVWNPTGGLTAEWIGNKNAGPAKDAYSTITLEVTWAGWKRRPEDVVRLVCDVGDELKVVACRQEAERSFGVIGCSVRWGKGRIDRLGQVGVVRRVGPHSVTLLHGVGANQAELEWPHGAVSAGLSSVDVDTLKVQELKALLQEQGLSTTGLKPDLVRRLKKEWHLVHVKDEQGMLKLRMQRATKLAKILGSYCLQRGASLDASDRVAFTVSGQQFSFSFRGSRLTKEQLERSAAELQLLEGSVIDVFREGAALGGGHASAAAAGSAGLEEAPTAKKRPREDGNAEQDPAGKRQRKVIELPVHEALQLFPVSSSEVVARCGARQVGGAGGGSSALTVKAGEVFEIEVAIKTGFGAFPRSLAPLAEHMVREITLLPADLVKQQADPQFSPKTGVAKFRVHMEKAGAVELSAAIMHDNTRHIIGGRRIGIKVTPGEIVFESLVACFGNQAGKPEGSPPAMPGTKVRTISRNQGAPRGKSALSFSSGQVYTIKEIKCEDGKWFATETQYGCLWFPLTSTDIVREVEVGQLFPLLLKFGTKDVYGNEVDSSLRESGAADLAANVRLEAIWIHEGTEAPLCLPQPRLTSDGLELAQLQLRLPGLHTFRVQTREHKFEVKVNVVLGSPKALHLVGEPRTQVLRQRRWSSKISVLNEHGHAAALAVRDLSIQLTGGPGGHSYDLEMDVSWRDERVKGCSLSDAWTVAKVPDVEVYLTESDAPASAGTYVLHARFQHSASGRSATIACDPGEVELDLPLDPALWTSEELAKTLRLANFPVPGEMVKDEFDAQVCGKDLINSGPHEMYRLLGDCVLSQVKFANRDEKNQMHSRLQLFADSLVEKNTLAALGKGKFKSCVAKCISESELGLERQPFDQGGTSAIFKGEHEGVSVAVKVPFFSRGGGLAVSDETVGVMREVEQELTVTKACSCPNVVQIFGLMVGPGRIGIVMELCQKSLAKHILESQQPANWAEFVRLLMDGAAGLAFIHRHKKTTHGDVKPDNLLIQGDKLKVSDFGLAKVQRTMTKITGDVSRKGTSYFMAPELLLGQDGGVSREPATDVWGFGCVIANVVTGNTPFASARSEQELLAQLRQQQPVFSRDAVLAGCPKRLLDLIDRCCAYQPGDRPTMDVVESELRGTLESIQRKDGFGLPPPWLERGLRVEDSSWKMLECAAGSVDYQLIKTRFEAEMGASNATVLKVEMNGNVDLFRRYDLERDKIRQQNGGESNEGWFWHATRSRRETEDKILEHGFDTNYCGLDYEHYGAGIYLASDSKMSNHYAAASSRAQPLPSTRTMLLVRAACGKIFERQPLHTCAEYQQMLLQPAHQQLSREEAQRQQADMIKKLLRKPENRSTPEGSHSQLGVDMTGRRKGRTELVVNKSYQAFPAYRITYSLRRALPCPIKEGKEALQTLDDYKSSAFHRQAVTDKRL